MLTIDAVEPVIRKMPPDLQRKALKYIELLAGQKKEVRSGSMKFAWAGCCADLKEKYTSVQLQKKILDWWG
jgi:hypothetical protein